MLRALRTERHRLCCWSPSKESHRDGPCDSTPEADRSYFGSRGFLGGIPPRRRCLDWAPLHPHQQKPKKKTAPRTHKPPNTFSSETSEGMRPSCRSSTDRPSCSSLPLSPVTQEGSSAAYSVKWRARSRAPRLALSPSEELGSRQHGPGTTGLPKSMSRRALRLTARSHGSEGDSVAPVDRHPRPEPTGSVLLAARCRPAHRLPSAPMRRAASPRPA